MRQQPGPGPAGSWAGPAWFKMLLGLGGNQGGGGEPGWCGGGDQGGGGKQGGGGGGGGGKRDNFMYLYHNFSLVNQKRMLWVFVHTNFSIRVFWERRDM